MRQRSFACVVDGLAGPRGRTAAATCATLSDGDAADDVLQDVFVKAMRQGQGFCSLDNPRAWLFQVARNALVDRARTAHAH